MRRLFFQVFMLIRTMPESQARIMKASAMLEAGEVRWWVRVRREMRIRIGMKARVINVQSRAIKLADGCELGFCVETAKIKLLTEREVDVLVHHLVSVVEILGTTALISV